VSLLFDDKFQLTVGLEVHVELATSTKMFCRCPSSFGDLPNTNVCPTCLGYPGSLPVLNEEAVKLGVRAAMALNCEVKPSSRFDRKNYFYPDLSKGYQITQYYEPLALNGYIELGPAKKKIRIRRLHLEEDTGKSIHAGDEIITATHSLIDYNRAGVPLIEIVSEPDISTPEEAREYVEKMRRILLFAGVSDVKIEEGSMRVDCNVSVSPKRGSVLGVPVELKNLGSLRAVSRAVSYEFNRQRQVIEGGGRIKRETRHWDESKNMTLPLRVKESSDDYRYFPEPDLPRLNLTQEFLDDIRTNMPPLHEQVVERYLSLGLSQYDTSILTQDPRLSQFFDTVVESGAEPKDAANWIMGDLMGYMKQAGLGFDSFPISPENLAELLTLINEGTISGKIAKDVLVKTIENGKNPSCIVKEEGLEQVSDESSLEIIVDEIIEENPSAVQEYRNGKTKALSFLVGQVMKASRGKANPTKVNIILKNKILS
jgi:aspartyl-tRNA(Asn)/glutamyl-tRNA(Gln) amidotransferase subunit B